MLVLSTGVTTVLPGLKAAVRDVGPDHARRDFDYVLIARKPALTSAFGAIVSDLVKALERVHRAPAKAR